MRRHYQDGQEQLPITNGGSSGFANAGTLVDVLAENDAPLVLPGHLHHPATA